MTVTERNGDLLAAFPVEEADQIMLVTDGGTLIRCPVNDIRIAGRNTQGVTIFKTDDACEVVCRPYGRDCRRRRGQRRRRG